MRGLGRHLRWSPRHVRLSLLPRRQFVSYRIHKFSEDEHHACSITLNNGQILSCLLNHDLQRAIDHALIITPDIVLATNKKTIIPTTSPTEMASSDSSTLTVEDHVPQPALQINERLFDILRVLFPRPEVLLIGHSGNHLSAVTYNALQRLLDSFKIPYDIMSTVSN